VIILGAWRVSGTHSYNILGALVAAASSKQQQTAESSMKQKQIAENSSKQQQPAATSSEYQQLTADTII